MKKVLSLFLAVLMIFACLSVGAYADDPTEPTTQPVAHDEEWHGPQKPATFEQVVCFFDTNGGTLKNAVLVYDTTVTGKFTSVENFVGTYVMVPQNDSVMKPGYTISLPAVEAPKGYQFDGWYCFECAGAPHIVRNTYGAASFVLPEGTAGTNIKFVAAYSPAKVEEDTMAKVMGILFKVFGTIIGLLIYGGDSEQGIAVMQKIFGSVFN